MCTNTHKHSNTHIWCVTSCITWIALSFRQGILASVSVTDVLDVEGKGWKEVDSALFTQENVEASTNIKEWMNGECLDVCVCVVSVCMSVRESTNCSLMKALPLKKSCWCMGIFCWRDVDWEHGSVESRRVNLSAASLLVGILTALYLPDLGGNEVEWPCVRRQAVQIGRASCRERV